ncbi:MAG TPA: zinc-ribbon domain-containing protein [Firmicutes bacterium]|nr:zinc-ribbon domain-containing protein [Bacillota bacterium]
MKKEYEKMYCIHCGKEIPDDCTFCIYCGKATASAPESSPDASSDAKQETPVQDIPASPASSVTSKTPTTSPVSHSALQNPTASSVPPAAPQTPKAPTVPPAFSYIQPVTYYKDTRKISAICLIGFIFSVISFVAGVILLTMALCGSSGVLVELYYVLPALAGLALSIFGLLRTPATECGKALAIVGIVLAAVILAYFYIAIFVSVGMTL